MLAVRATDRIQQEQLLLQSVDDFTQALRLRANYVEAWRRRGFLDGSRWFRASR